MNENDVLLHNEEFTVIRCACQPGGCGVIYVNGQQIMARWGEGGLMAQGEVLSRAVVLACQANPIRMRHFPCGSML